MNLISQLVTHIQNFGSTLGSTLVIKQKINYQVSDVATHTCILFYWHFTGISKQYQYWHVCFYYLYLCNLTFIEICFKLWKLYTYRTLMLWQHVYSFCDGHLIKMCLLEHNSFYWLIWFALWMKDNAMEREKSKRKK